MTKHYERQNEDVSFYTVEGYIHAISHFYVSGYYLDLKREKYVAIGQLEEYYDRYGSENDWSVMDDYIRECIHEEDQALITEVSRIDYIRDRLSREENYSIEVRDHGTGQERWYRFTVMRGTDEDHAALSFMDVTDQVLQRQEMEALNSKLVEAASEQEAQLEEITALNGQLEENQNRLEESASEQEAQIEEITALNRQLEENQTDLEEARREAEESEKRISEAYGMIEGLSQEYHTIWVVSKETSRMRLIRSSGVSTIQNAVQMGKDYPEFDAGFDQYIETYVEPEDRERMHREIAFDEVLRQLKQREKTGGLYAVNYLRRDDSGHVGYHQIAFVNADTDSGQKQFVYGFRDIDKLIKQEQAIKEELREAKMAAEAANNAKTAFLFNMSHDIRTPMNAIIGFRELLEKYQDDPEKRAEYLRKIDDSSAVLLAIINNVLEMARIEKGGLTIEETAWSAEELNDSMYSVFEEMMQKKEITFTRQINVEHNYVFCDSTKVREIFINILSNAYKYTGKGGTVNMTVDELPCDRPGYVLYKTVISDTGIGMAEDYLPHIFEEFSRENNSLANRIEGTGLGLPIVKRLVEAMGGTIEAASKKGVGSAFTVTIPHRIAEKEEQTIESGTEAELDASVFEGKRILLAEDNDYNAEIAMELLEDEGFEVERAEDGRIACDKLAGAEAHYYDLILMDIQMPNMNGYEATREIRKMDDPEKSGITIVAMTANAFEEDRKEAFNAGMDGHIPKPVRANVLLKELAEVFAK